jgi:hypothetical protein
VTATDVQATEHTVTARKARQCEGWRCWVRIQPGEDYVRSVAFPGHEANGGDRPWVMHICKGCHTQYGREMPPRRTRKSSPPSPSPERNTQ